MPEGAVREGHHSAPGRLSAYRPDVDGMRAVAVLGVLFFHAGLGLSGGYAGVDVFFVISGFLITRLLAHTMEDGTFTLAEFWHRRIRRLLPALSTLVLAVLACGTVLLLPADLELLAESSAAQAVLGANFWFWQQAGYFGPEVESLPLLHTWSLAVEEQFYLFYPLPFVWLLRNGLARTRLVLAIVFVGSLGLSAWLTTEEPSASFYLLPTRAWELVTGALLAVGTVPAIASRWGREAVGWIGAAAIATSFVVYDGTTPFPGLAALLPCLGTAAIIHANTHGTTALRRVLSWRPLVFVGLISYSLYLWHWPILVYLRQVADEAPSVASRCVALAVSVAIATLSWRFVETPIRRGRILRSRSSIFAAAGGLTAMPLAFSALVLVSGGLPQRFSAEVLALGSVKEDEDEGGATAPGANPSRNWRELAWGKFHLSLDEAKNGRLLVLGDESKAGERPHFVLWGDSHAGAVLKVLDDVAKERGVMGYAATAAATLPLLGTRRPRNKFPALEYNEAVIAFIEAQKPEHVILVGRWSVNVEGRENGELDSLIVDERGMERTVENARGAFRRGLERTLSRLAALDTEVWIMKEIPTQRANVPRMLARAMQRGKDLSTLGVTAEEHRERLSFVDSVLQSHVGEHVHLLDPDPILFDASGHSTVHVGDDPAYRDRHHLTEAGAGLLAPMFESVFGS